MKINKREQKNNPKLSATKIRKVIEIGINDTGNVASTCVSLYFERLRRYDVNTNKVSYKERVAYTWSTLLWFTSFHKYVSTMLENKLNITIDSIDL